MNNIVVACPVLGSQFIPPLSLPSPSRPKNFHIPHISTSSSSSSSSHNLQRTSSSPNIRNSRRIKKTTTSASAATSEMEGTDKAAIPPMKLLFVEMGVGYDQHGQDITVAAMRACRDAITSNSIPAFRTGTIPGVNTDNMKLQIKLGVPRSTQQFLDIERVKSVFPYGQIINFEVMDGGMICSSGVCLEAMGDKNDDCYVVNAAVYVGY